MKNNLVLKRLGAYIIDALIIGMLSGIISGFTFINPNKEEYQNVIRETENLTNDYLDLIKNQKEDNSNNENNEDNKIDNNEETDNNEITNENKKTMEDIQSELKALQYKSAKYGYIYIISDIVIALLYFGIFTYFMKGQTIGKKILGLKIVSNKEKSLTPINYFIRTIILNGIIGNILTLIGVLFNEDIFYKINSIGSATDLMLKVIIFVMIVSNINGRGLHDILAGTKVVSIKEDNMVKKEGELVNENS